MMISAETYYEMNRNRTPEELEKEIKYLKREINRLKKSLENPTDSEDIIFPDNRTQLAMDRQYLKAIIQAYEEAGGTYVPTGAERKAIDFNQTLDSMDKMVFSIGGFFEGFETRTYTLSGDQFIVDAEHSFRSGEPSDSYCVPKEEFLSELKDVYIGEWKRRYDDPFVLDGTQWELEIHYADGRKIRKYSGSNAYPVNFDDLLRLLGVDTI